MSETTSCVFCKILRGEIPAVRIYENDQTFAFMDIQPASTGHTLVIPKHHAATLLEMPTGDLHAAIDSTQKVARAIQQALTPDGMRISQLNGTAAGQTVFHYHVHIIPQWDGMKICGHGRIPVAPETLRTIAEKIQAAL